MKRFAVLSAIVAVGLGTSVTMAQQGGFTIPPPDPIEKITDRLYKVGGAFAGNTTVFLRSDGLVLVDTKNNGSGKAILDEIRKVTDLPVTTIINTHTHPDHIGNNAYFREADPTIDIVMHANANKAAATAPYGGPKSLANIAYKKSVSLGMGDDMVKVYHFGPGHTNGDSFVYFPSEKAMVTGDIMAWDMGAVIDTMSGGSMLELPKTLDGAVQAFEGNVDKVIEGHGKVDDWAIFTRYVSYTHKVVEVARRGVAEDLNYVEAYEKYFATDPAMAHYIGEQVFKGLEYGGTPKSRTLNNLYIAMAQLRGEEIGMTMGAPPPPKKD